MKIERMPGPWIGPEVELARECARIAVIDYGNDFGDQFLKIVDGNIWNDHVAVQAAMAMYHTLKINGMLNDARL